MRGGVWVYVEDVDELDLILMCLFFIFFLILSEKIVHNIDGNIVPIAGKQVWN